MFLVYGRKSWPAYTGNVKKLVDFFLKYLNNMPTPRNIGNSIDIIDI